MSSENITKVLYPERRSRSRAKSCGSSSNSFSRAARLQDMLRIHALLGGTPATFHEKWAVQLNDTHPAVAVAELMRLLVDEHALGWDEAWEVTRATFAYTNHTLLPEALEKWTRRSFRLAAAAASRDRLRDQSPLSRRSARAFPGDDARLARLSLIDESGPRYVRMAHLARSAATPSTASRSFTPSCSSKRCCAISRSFGRRNFAMSPMA